MEGESASSEMSAPDQRQTANIDELQNRMERVWTADDELLKRVGHGWTVNADLKRIADLLERIAPLLEAIVQRERGLLAPVSGGYTRSPRKPLANADAPASPVAIRTLIDSMVRKGLEKRDAVALVQMATGGEEMTVTILQSLTHQVWLPDFLAEARAKLAAAP